MFAIVVHGLVFNFFFFNISMHISPSIILVSVCSRRTRDRTKTSSFLRSPGVSYCSRQPECVPKNVYKYELRYGFRIVNIVLHKSFVSDSPIFVVSFVQTPRRASLLTRTLGLFWIPVAMVPIKMKKKKKYNNEIKYYKIL